MTLTTRQELFVLEYLKDLNATQAAIRAGYSQDTAGSIGSENLQKPEISAAIAEAAAKRLQRVQIEADFVLKELYGLSNVDPAAAYDEDGNLKPIHDIPIAVRKAIASIEVEEIFEGRGNDRKLVGHVRKVRFWPKDRALEMLARHKALFNDKVNVNVSSIAERLIAGRKRAGGYQ